MMYWGGCQAARPPSRASRIAAPSLLQWFCVGQNLCAQPGPCGSGLARDGGLSVNDDVESGRLAFAFDFLALYRDAERRFCAVGTRRKGGTIGGRTAGTDMYTRKPASNDRPSRASSLLQWFCVGQNLCAQPGSCGSGLARDGGLSVNDDVESGRLAFAFDFLALYRDAERRFCAVGTRRKGGTLGGRYRRNGYVHPQASVE